MCAAGVSLPGFARRAISRLVLSIAALTLVAACNSKGGAPTSPTAPQPSAGALPAAPASLIVGALVMKDRTAAISWGASSGATEYVVEVGSTAGGTDGGIHTAGAATSFTLRDLTAGRSHVRLKARNSAGTSGASAEVTFVLPDLGDYVEALFLGSGPLIPDTPADPNLSCPRRGTWSGFARGTTVRNLASAQIPAQYRDAIRGVLDQVPQATDGRLATTFEVVADDAPRSADNHMVHVAIRSAGELQAACGSRSGSACIGYNSTPFLGGVIRWSSGWYVVTTVQSTRPYAHEPGHGVLGMCHINAEGIGGHQYSLMAASQTPGAQPDRLSPFDIEALRAVYGSSVAIGAGRAQFVAASLLRP
jgi:hypothetical protein